MQHSSRVVRTFPYLRPLALFLVVIQLVFMGGCSWTVLVSRSSALVQGNDGSFTPELSFDGRYVVFSSDASNLVPGDTNVKRDVFLHDVLTGSTSLVSASSAGVQGTDDSEAPSISADGRYVAFTSRASNLVANDTNGRRDVFVRDMDLGTVQRVSLSSGGVQGNGDSFDPVISDDGRYVAFVSLGNNLAPTANNLQDVFVRDLVSGTTAHVSISVTGTANGNDSAAPSISSDGRYIAFWSTSPILVNNDNNGRADVFLRDTVLETTSLVSLSGAGVQGTGTSDEPEISSDGRYVVFTSAAANLVADDFNARKDIFLRDIVGGTTSRVSLSTSGSESNGHSDSPKVSDDGRYVAFISNATDIVPSDTNNAPDTFVRDLATGKTTRVSVDEGGGQAFGSSLQASISGDGRYVAISTDAANLVPNDANGERDIIMRNIVDLRVDSISPDSLVIGMPTAVSILGENFLPGTTPLLPDAVVTDVVISGESAISAIVTLDAGASQGPNDVSVLLPGTGPGVGAGAVATCADCVMYVPGC